MKRRVWRVLVPALAILGLAGAALPAVAAQTAADSNNRLQVRMSFHCNSNGTVRLSWHSIWPKQATHMTAQWYDATTDPDLQSPTAGKVHRSGSRASGTFTIPAGHNRHQIWLFVDALDNAGNQVFGIGRKESTIRC